MPGTCLNTVLEALRGLQMHLQALEYNLQDRIGDALSWAAVPYEREYLLGPRNRVDFLCDGGIAIEVKKGKPGSKALAAQAERYAEFDAVQTLVLVVERCVFDVPEEISGKPVYYVALSRNWGISL